MVVVGKGATVRGLHNTEIGVPYTPAPLCTCAVLAYVDPNWEFSTSSLLQIHLQTYGSLFELL